jgi:hypothetical protein
MNLNLREVKTTSNETNGSTSNETNGSTEKDEFAGSIGWNYTTTYMLTVK